VKLKWQGTEDYFGTGFTSQNDPFQRGDLAKRLTKLFTSLEHGAVALIDGRWGSGKTIFCKTWVRQLRQDNVPVVYIDAFASDYLRDGFTAISAALLAEATSIKSDDDRVRRFLTSATEVGKRVLVASAKVGVKAATLGVVGK
jgi:KaiC/GvpD/RAD55 family RecA-like ATPase